MKKIFSTLYGLFTQKKTSTKESSGPEMLASKTPCCGTNENDNVDLFQPTLHGDVKVEERCTVKEIPSFCLLVVNKQCNFHCKMCNMWKHKADPQSLSLEEMKSVVLDLRTFVDEPIFIHLIGGETLLWPHTTELASFITQNGFRTSITTNGYLIDHDMARKIVASGMSGIFISLDSLQAQKHDYIRGMKGAYKRVMQAIDNLYQEKIDQQSDISIGITMTIMNMNVDELVHMATWVHEHEKVDALFYNAVLQPFDAENIGSDWYKRKEHAELWPQDYQKVYTALDVLKTFKQDSYEICNPPEQLDVLKAYFKNPFSFMKDMNIKCPRGDLSLEVNAVGDIAMCFDMPALGNVHKNRVSEVWFSNRMQKARKEIDTCRKGCDVVVNCFYKLENITDNVSDDSQSVEVKDEKQENDNVDEIVPPRTCLLTVSNKCDLHCKMCDLWKKETLDNELSINECKHFIETFDAFQSDPQEFHLIGGEALIKEGIFDLIRFLNTRGSRTVVTTSAYPINEDVARKIGDAGLNHINISLESLDGAIHDRMRGKPGTYDKAMQAIDYVSRYAPQTKIGINTIIMKDNSSELASIAQWANSDSRIASLYFMAVMRPIGSDLDLNWYQSERAQILWPDNHGILNEQLDALIASKQHYTKLDNSVGQLNAFKSYFTEPLHFIKTQGCHIDKLAININAVGDAYLCFFMESIGNIRQKSAYELWHSPEAAQVRKKMRTCNRNCELLVNCYYEDEE